MSVSEDFKKQIEGYGLTTAQIYYRMPDKPTIICPHWFLWQQYDVCPLFPELFKFLNYWHAKLEGPIHSVTVAHERLVKPAEIRPNVSGTFELN